MRCLLLCVLLLCVVGGQTDQQTGQRTVLEKGNRTALDEENGTVLSVFVDRLWDCLRYSGYMDYYAERPSDVDVIKFTVCYNNSNYRIWDDVMFCVYPDGDDAGSALIRTLYKHRIPYSYVSTVLENIEDSDWDCLDEVNGSSVFDECMGIESLEPYLPITCGGCDSYLCREYYPRAKAECYDRIEERNCTEDVIKIITVFLESIFYYCQSLTQVSTDISPFVQCQTSQFTSPFIFPPSEYSIATTNDLHQAQFLQGYIMLTLCSKKRYKECIKSCFEEKRFFHLMFNVSGVAEAMDIYCSNRELIESQFQCTVKAVKETPCNGGVLDVWNNVYNQIFNSFSLTYSCSEIMANIECRIEQQLRPCNSEYAGVMEEVYRTMLTEQCLQGDSFPITEILPCFVDLYDDFSTRFASYDNITTVLSATVDAANAVCSDLDNLIDCIDNMTETSTQLLDKMFRQMYNVGNIRSIMSTMCSMVQNFTDNLECLERQFHGLMYNDYTCLNKLLNELPDVTKLSLDNIPNAIQTRMDEIRECFMPWIMVCDIELGIKFDSLLSAMYTSFNRPYYVLPDLDLCGGGRCQSATTPPISTSSTIVFNVWLSFTGLILLLVPGRT